MKEPIDIPICKICLVKYGRLPDDGTRLAALAADLNLVPYDQSVDADLLEACRLSLRHGKFDGNKCYSETKIISVLTDAIKKAEGNDK